MLLAFFALGAQHSAAAAGGLNLAWRAPKECPAEQSVVDEVSRIIHRPVQLADGETLAVRADVRAPSKDGLWHVDLETDNGQHIGRRSLDASTCDELARATSLFVAIMIDPAAATSAAPAPAAPGSSVAAPASPVGRPAGAAPRSASVAQSSAPASPAAAPWAVGLSLGVLGGYLPSWSAGAGLHAVAEWPWVRAEIGGYAWLPAGQSVDPAGVQGADFQLFSGEAAACLMLPVQAVTLGPCVGADLAFISGKGFGPLVAPQQATARFWSVAAGGLLVWRASRLVSFPIGVEALFAVSPPQFSFTGSDPGQIYKPSSVGVRSTFGAEIHL
jgi:hypothetical protein